MKIDRDHIDRVSRLARLSLSDAEKDGFAEQISRIISYVEKIGALDTAAVEPADHIVPVQNVFREDVPAGSLDRAVIAEMAPRFEEGHFIVPRIIEGS